MITLKDTVYYSEEEILNILQVGKDKGLDAKAVDMIASVVMANSLSVLYEVSIEDATKVLKQVSEVI